MLELVPKLFLSGKAYDLAATGGTAQLTLSFLPVPGARSYEYQISSTSAVAGFGAWTTLATNKIIGSLSGSTQYWVRVRAVNGMARGPGGRVATATTSAAAATPPSYIAGSLQTFYPGGTGLDNAGTVSTAINVPANATMAVGCISGWKGFTNNYFSDGAMTFTKGGVDTAMVPVQSTPRADTTAANHNAAMFYLPLPDTGTGKTWKWDWVGTSSTDRSTVFSIIFLKDVDTSSPVRGNGGGQATALPVNTGTITALSGDLIVAFVGISLAAAATEATIDSWSNATLLSQVAQDFNFSDAAWATALPSGNTTVGAATGTGCADVAIIAISVKPAP